MPARTNYRIVVIELEDIVPRRDPGKPNLYVGIASAQHESLAELVDHAPEWLRGKQVELRRDMMPSNGLSTMRRSGDKTKSLKARLMSEGFTVNRNHADVFRLYVIELEPKPGTDVGAGEVYVGETSRSIEERYEQHRQGGRLSVSCVEQRGIGLRHDLIPQQIYFSRAASRGAEARLAERLRSRGFLVRGGR